MHNFDTFALILAHYIHPNVNEENIIENLFCLFISMLALFVWTNLDLTKYLIKVPKEKDERTSKFRFFRLFVPHKIV